MNLLIRAAKDWTGTTRVVLMMAAPVTLLWLLRAESKDLSEAVAASGLVTYALVLGASVLVYFHWRMVDGPMPNRLAGWLAIGLLLGALARAHPVRAAAHVHERGTEQLAAREPARPPAGPRRDRDDRRGGRCPRRSWCRGCDRRGPARRRVRSRHDPRRTAGRRAGAGGPAQHDGHAGRAGRRLDRPAPNQGVAVGPPPAGPRGDPPDRSPVHRQPPRWPTRAGGLGRLREHRRGGRAVHDGVGPPAAGDR